MAVKPTHPQPPAKDVDDAHADRIHGKKKDEAASPRPEKKELTTPEQKAFHQGELKREADVERKTKERVEAEKRRKKEKDQEEQEGESQSDEGSVKAGQLALDDNYKRRHTARKLGLDGTPGLGEITDGFDAEPEGEKLGQMIGARQRHPALPEAEIEPPPFLKPLEAMHDIYMKTRGRVTRRTKELLEGVDLEDLIALLDALFVDELLVRKSEARLRRDLLDRLGPDPGPLLAGFHDPRLTEPWRLFLEGWDIWVPEGKETGVDLFWEGEAEDDDGNVIEILQSLQFRDGEATLTVKLGDLEDRITFDGEAFYRLKTVLD